MFTASGQLDLLTFGGMRGGGGKGGGGQSAPPQGRTYVDPVDGTVFAESPYEAMLGGGVNPDGTPRQTAAEQYNAHLRERKAGETAASTAKTAEAATAKTEAANTFTTDKGNAYNNALANVRRTFELQGLNPDTYMTSDIAPKLSSINSGISDASGLTPPPSMASYGDSTNTVPSTGSTYVLPCGGADCPPPPPLPPPPRIPPNVNLSS